MTLSLFPCDIDGRYQIYCLIAKILFDSKISFFFTSKCHWDLLKPVTWIRFALKMRANGDVFCAEQLFFFSIIQCLDTWNSRKVIVWNRKDMLFGEKMAISWHQSESRNFEYLIEMFWQGTLCKTESTRWQCDGISSVTSGELPSIYF